MGRFDYLGKDKGGKKARRAALQPVHPPAAKVTPEPDARRLHGPEPLEAVYLRRETVQTVWKQIKKDGGESVSELVEDLLLAWLRTRS